MAGITNTAVFTTIDTIMKNRKWLFYEKGMMHVWNELQFAFAATLVSPGATISVFDNVAQFTPDYLFLVNQSGQTPAAPPTQSR